MDNISSNIAEEISKKADISSEDADVVLKAFMDVVAEQISMKDKEHKVEIKVKNYEIR